MEEVLLKNAEMVFLQKIACSKKDLIGLFCKIIYIEFHITFF